MCGGYDRVDNYRSDNGSELTIRAKYPSQGPGVSFQRLQGGFGVTPGK